MHRVERALLSVSNKSGIVEFAQGLVDLGVELVSSGGTAKALGDAGIDAKEVSSLTGFPEMLDGRVKTLHPVIHGGILARDTPEHMAQLESHGIGRIDLVAVNLYPFKETVAANKPLAEAIENIDIGGPTLVRAAAKNHERVTIVVNPARYNDVLEALRKGDVPEELRRELAVEAYMHTASYDIAIHNYLWTQYMGGGFPERLFLEFEKAQDLRYGENPYQNAAFYKERSPVGTCIANSRQLHGKELSYNNILDLNDALALIMEFRRPVIAEIKHTNPCGVAVADTLHEAYLRCHSIDPLSAFGGIVAANRELDLATANEISKVFVECVIAPAFTNDAIDLLRKKKNIRLIETGPLNRMRGGLDYKRVDGGLLVQDMNRKELAWGECQIPTKRTPSDEERASLEFAWKLVKHVKSNAVVYTNSEMAIGIGAGQMSRVDSAIIAARKGGEHVKGAVMASDAFFPFRDGVDTAAKAGITAIIQPGGSVRDQEVIDAADEHGIAMVFTGYRVFKH